MAGLGRRLKKSLETIIPQGAIVNIVEPIDRHISAWVGGSKMGMSKFFLDKNEMSLILFSLNSALSAQWLTKKEYEELGPEASLARMLSFPPLIT